MMRLVIVMKFEAVDTFVSLFVVVGCLSIPAVAGPILSYGDHDQLRADSAAHWRTREANIAAQRFSISSPVRMPICSIDPEVSPI